MYLVFYHEFGKAPTLVKCDTKEAALEEVELSCNGAIVYDTVKDTTQMFDEEGDEVF